MRVSRFGQGSPAACAAAAAAAAVLLALAATVPVTASPSVRRVAIKVVMYTPATLTVERGDTIIWKNEDPVPHTVTADGGAFDSGSIAPGSSWRYVARRPGDYAYHCTFHPNMHGILHVK